MGYSMMDTLKVKQKFINIIYILIHFIASMGFSWERLPRLWDFNDELGEFSLRGICRQLSIVLLYDNIVTNG